MKTKITKYFAAANSFFGFQSLFDEVFLRKKFNKIYVIKGGPGTGKSSLMKAVSKEFENKDCNVEYIYCSSDPDSLDGVIIEKNERRIALLDGTAPHQTDAVLPGVCDEIINLAEGIDSRFLSAQRDNILSLDSEKKKCYRSAYDYLSIAGKAEKIIHSVYILNFDIFATKSLAEGIILNFACNDRSEKKRRFISSFGKRGLITFYCDFIDFEKLVRIGGDPIKARILIGYLYKNHISKATDSLLLPYPLDPDLYDGILLPEEKTGIIYDSESEQRADEFFSLNKADEEKIKKAKQLKDEALTEAQRWFSVAADMHFRLEEIYGEAMDFRRNESVLNNLIPQIENILENAI